jgi:hypothetical protein
MKIIGAIERHGISKKTGRPYDLTIATAIHPDLRPGAFGSKVEEITLNANTYPAESIKINSTYMVDYDSRGYCIGFEPILETTKV